jgi:hypothetical protein
MPNAPPQILEELEKLHRHVVRARLKSTATMLYETRHRTALREISARATRNEHSRGCECDRAGIAHAEQRLPFMRHLEKTQAAKLVDWVGARS